MSDYKPVIGLEIHVELKTLSKMFCGCINDPFGAKQPNVYTCPVCLGMPGALPVPNKKAIDWTILIGKALNCKINEISKFDRKHYFYPDLPKGYQISQYDEPIAVNGNAVIARSETTKQSQNKEIAALPAVARNDRLRVRIQRVHLEEDTAKLIHEGGDTLIDFNRSGVPLVEIVTEPDFDNADDVKRFLEELHVIVRYLGVSDADMEKGSMRLEPNISVREIHVRDTIKVEDKPHVVIASGAKQSHIVNNKIATSSRVLTTPRNDILFNLPNYKVEVKNINSFRFVKQAIEYEVERQIEILKEGKTPAQETRGFDSGKSETYSQRSKEEAHDYRYFPEPDIPPLFFDTKYVSEIEKQIPELPQMKLERYVKQYNIRYQDAFVITRDKKLVDYYEEICSLLESKIQKPEQSIANFLINKKISSKLSTKDFVTKATELLTPKKTDEKLLDSSIIRIIGANVSAVEDYKKGKVNAVMFLVGQVMRDMKGKADPTLIKKKLLEKLSV